MGFEAGCLNIKLSRRAVRIVTDAAAGTESQGPCSCDLVGVVIGNLIDESGGSQGDIAAAGTHGIGGQVAGLADEDSPTAGRSGSSQVAAESGIDHRATRTDGRAAAGRRDVEVVRGNSGRIVSDTTTRRERQVTRADVHRAERKPVRFGDEGASIRTSNNQLVDRKIQGITATCSDRIRTNYIQRGGGDIDICIVTCGVDQIVGNGEGRCPGRSKRSVNRQIGSRSSQITTSRERVLHCQVIGKNGQVWCKGKRCTIIHCRVSIHPSGTELNSTRGRTEGPEVSGIQRQSRGTIGAGIRANAKERTVGSGLDGQRATRTGADEIAAGGGKRHLVGLQRNVTRAGNRGVGVNT